MTPALSPSAVEALTFLRQGKRDKARALLLAAQGRDPDDPSLNALLGMLACEEKDFSNGITYLRRAWRGWPDDFATRKNLALALLQSGDPSEVIAVTRRADRDPALLRARAFSYQQLGQWEEAVSAYRILVDAAPEDFEIWNNLANVLAEQGKSEDAMDAFEQAIHLQPSLPILYINYGKILTGIERDADRLTVLRRGAAVCSHDDEIALELGLAAAAVGNYEEAEQAYCKALKINPALTAAYVEYALMLENLNRIDDLKSLLKDARRLSNLESTSGELDFIEAWILRREGHFEEALTLARSAPDTVNPVRRYQLIAELLDRVGDSAGAFEAFGEMNAQAVAISAPAPPEENYRQEVEQVAALLTPAQVSEWTSVSLPSSPPAPTFIIGFPRSGTTLLDTFLMNLPDLHVMEEMPVMRQVEVALGPPANIADLDDEKAAYLRDRYFEALAVIAPPPPNARIVDKYPLHMARMPLIHRIFPNAPIIFVERHPYDVVLSCFMANFKLNRAMRHFTTLEETALLYDRVFTAWERSRALFPLSVHTIRYEHMVVDTESELKHLLHFLDIPWTDDVLDNQGAASRRNHIKTASYAQVIEPVYKRAAGRWRRYRAQLAPVIPILRPWAQKMGYDID